MKPYSTDRLAELLEQKYESHGRFAFKKALGDGHYLFYDSEHVADFVVTASVETDHLFEPLIGPILPIKRRFWAEYLNTGIVYAHRERAAALALKYGLKRLQNNIDLSENITMYTDMIYISEFAQIDSVAAFFCDIRELYRLEGKSSTLFMAIYYNSDPGKVTGGIEDNLVGLGNWGPEMPFSDTSEPDGIAGQIGRTWANLEGKGIIPKRGELRQWN